MRGLALLVLSLCSRHTRTGKYIESDYSVVAGWAEGAGHGEGQRVV